MDNNKFIFKKVYKKFHCFIQSIFYPYINLAFVPFVCLFVRPSVMFFHLGQMKKKIRQTLSICQVWSPELISHIRGDARAPVHAQHVKMCTLLQLLIWPLFCQFFKVLNPFLTENEKIEATFHIGIDKAHFFHFTHFFPFQSGFLQNSRNVQKNYQNSTFLPSGAQNMNLRTKSHKINFFCQMLKGHLNHYRY